MKTSDRILATLTELAEESRTPELMGRAYPGIEREVADLMPVHTQLKRLPKDISLSAPAKAALRAQLMANIRQAALEAETAPWWRRAVDSVTAAFTPAAFAQALARPAAMALAVTMSFTAAGVTTVSAALDSIPGDGLYSVKTAYEDVVLAVQIDDERRIRTYFWQAGLRLEEIRKLWSVGRAEEASKLASKLDASVEGAEKTAEKSTGNQSGLVGVLQQRFENDVRTAPPGVRQLVKAQAATPLVVDAMPSPSIQAAQTQAPEPVSNSVPQQPGSLEPVTEGVTATGGRIPDSKTLAGEPVGAKPAATNDPKEPIAQPDWSGIPAKSGDSAPPSGPVTAPVTTRDQPGFAEPAKPEPVTVPAEIPSKEPPAASQPGGLEPKPQARNDPSGFDGGKSDGSGAPTGGLPSKQ
ncbi:MAG: hypothetical protein EXR52_07295 [Dehalococcoidia bacterium]|nr:hypothetical protein [Dehalococcoidia bacterium]